VHRRRGSRPAHRHPDKRAREAKGDPPREQPGDRTARTDGGDHVSWRERQLVRQLLGRERVRRGSKAAAGTAGDEVGMAPIRSEPGGDVSRVLGCGGPIGIAGEHDAGTERPHHREVRVGNRRLAAVQHDGAGESGRRRRGSQRRAEVRALAAATYDVVALLVERVSDENLQRPHLVAAEGKAGQVVALDPHIAPQRVAQPRGVHERRR
jgi:hypothetical protein